MSRRALHRLSCSKLASFYHFILSASIAECTVHYTFQAFAFSLFHLHHKIGFDFDPTRASFFCWRLATVSETNVKCRPQRRVTLSRCHPELDDEAELLLEEWRRCRWRAGPPLYKHNQNRQSQDWLDNMPRLTAAARSQSVVKPHQRIQDHLQINTAKVTKRANKI